MNLLQELPRKIVELLQSGDISEYATLSAAGVPIDTPVLYFPSAGLQSIDLATGLAYPAKAERARKNPKVGLLIEGGPDEPVISIAGLAAVRDADLQANVERYLSEAGHQLPGDPEWSLARQAVWYWTRILIEVTPVQVLWWDSPAALDTAPQCWEAAVDGVYPQSDPAPLSTPSSASDWHKSPWQDLAKQAREKGAPSHLSVVDADGFPRPIRVQAIVQTEQGFTFNVPQGVPWAIAGKASLTFKGIETFIGEVRTENNQVVMKVERALPVFPMTTNPNELWQPSANTRDNLMRRLRHETERRGQPIPTIPEVRPAPTTGYQMRMARWQLLASNTRL